MGILQSPLPIPVTNGNYPQFKFAVFTDNLGAVTTAGYLNSSNIVSGFPLSNADIVMALYSYNQQTTSGTFGIFTVNIAPASGQIILTLWGNSGDAVLPTTANYLAHFTNTTGTISSASGNVIQPGNISAGLSGTAGTVASFPSVASKGSLILAGVANTGNTNTTISNSAMGQASVISIPDPGASTANFMLNTGATAMAAGSSIVMAKVNGTEVSNAMTANGVAGLITTSVITIGAGGSYTINWTNSFITSTSVVLLTSVAGTNTIEDYNLRCVPGNGSASLIIWSTSSASFNGTLTLSYLVM